ncbi:YegS/Rv2252/BmrU family lipid kinase [Priestia megaterium]|nr:YegS/Rv2252/BmrU family lipid kinase [Priestia megaterium]
MKAAVILNPNSGNKKLVHSIDKICDRLNTVFESVALYKTGAPGDGAKFVQQLADNIDVIVGAGGDGTIYELINAIAPMEKRPIFAILPGGTCNDFSRAIGMNQNPLLAVEQIIAKQKASVDVGKHNDQYFLNFWGIGLVAEISENIQEKGKEKLGKISYYMSVGRTFNQVQPFKVKMKSEEATYEGEAVMILIGNGPFLGGTRTVLGNCSFQDGLLDVYLIKQMALEPLVKWLQTAPEEEQTDPNSQLLHFKTTNVHVEVTPEKTVDCDGETETTTPSVISILPNHIDMFVGTI